MDFKRLLGKDKNYLKLAYKVVHRYVLIALEWLKKALKYVKSLKKQELKNYSLNLISVISAEDYKTKFIKTFKRIITIILSLFFILYSL